MLTLKKLLLSLVVVLFSYSTAAAYTPPPATNLFALLQPRFTISLPPLNIMNPARFRYSGVEYTITNGTITPSNGIVTVQKIQPITPGTLDDYYVIRIRGLEKDSRQSIKDLRLTFDPASKSAIDAQELYLNTTSLSNAFLSDSNCQVGATKSHICLISTITLRTLDGRLSPISLQQTLPLKGIIVEGNVAGVGLDGFTIDGNSIAVGDSVSVLGGTEVDSYFSASKLSWGTEMENNMTNIYEKRIRGSQVVDTSLGKTGNDGAFPGTSQGFGSCQNQPTWNLNSSISNSPCTGQSTSFTSPPEGKLWNIGKSNVPGVSGTFQLGAANVPVTFSGSGTLVFSGDVMINSPIRCQQGTRLGIITRGNIIFNTNSVECGTFMTMGGSSHYRRLGDISITNANDGNFKAILVAKNNVILPDVAALKGPFVIKYDSYFANDPTILFREILTIVKENLS